MKEDKKQRSGLKVIKKAEEVHREEAERAAAEAKAAQEAAAEPEGK